VQHEGIATHELGPDPKAVIKTPNGTVLKAGDPVVTYVARNLEPYRGFHIFMRALERIQKVHSSCQAVVVGGDEVSYGKRPVGAPTWREHMLREVTLDSTRTHFLGRVPRQEFIRVLQVSAVHVYLTYPFVLSWSFLEAMACACTVVGSRTSPVQEVIRDEVNGRLVDFFDVEGIADGVVSYLQSGPSPRGCLKVLLPQSRKAAVRGYDELLAANTATPDKTANEPHSLRPGSGSKPVIQRAESGTVETVVVV